MQKGIITLIILLISHAGLCQGKVLLSENFRNNKNGWQQRNDSSFSVVITNGVLRWQKYKKNFDDRGCLWYKKEIKGLNTLEDFSITIVAKFVDGGDIFDAFDIQWGNWDKVISSKITSIYQLSFFLKGDVKLDYFSKNWNYSLRQMAREINNNKQYRPGEFNNYEIVQKDGFVILSINDKQFFKQFASPIAGNSIGIQGCMKSIWEIDKIVVKQLKKKNTNEADSISMIAISDSLKQSGNSEENLKVFPNPFVNEFTVNVTTEKVTQAKIELFDMQGNLVMQYDRKLDVGKHLMRLYADVAAGTYVLKVTADNKTTTTKIVKL